MNEKGWSADPAVVLRHQVLTWLAAQAQADPSCIYAVGDVADAVGATVHQVDSLMDLLAEEGLALPCDGMVPASSSARLTPAGLAAASRSVSATQTKKDARAASRDALLDWLYEVEDQPADVSPFLADVRARYFARRFTEAEVNEALDFLEEHGLAKGISAAWGGSLLRPEITADGKVCVERYDGNVGAWLSRAAPGPTFSISHSQGVNIAADSPGANQTITISTDARRLMVQTADALLAMLPVLGLDADDAERARQVAQRLQGEAEQDEDDPSRVRELLKELRTVAVAGSGSAAGVGLVALAQQIAQAVGL